MKTLRISLLGVCLMASATIGFAQQTKTILYLDSISNGDFSTVPFIGDDYYDHGSYLYDAQGRNTQSRYRNSPYSLTREYCYCLRDSWDRIIDSNQKYLMEESSSYFLINDMISSNRALYGYDDKGNIVKKRHYKGSNGKFSLGSEFTYVYDDKGALIEYTHETYNVNNQWVVWAYERYENTYDSNDNITRCTTVVAKIADYVGGILGEAPSKIMDYTYDAKGNMVEKLGTHWQPQLDYWRECEKDNYAYDSMGRVVEHIRSWCWSDTKEWLGFLKYEYTYDAKGNMLMQIEYSAGRTDEGWTGWENNAKYEYTYDSMGNCTNIDMYLKTSSIPIVYNYEYTYLPYSETDVIIPDDYLVYSVSEDFKIKGVVSEVKASVPDKKHTHIQIEKTIIYHWNIQEIEIDDSVSVVQLEIEN